MNGRKRLLGVLVGVGAIVGGARAELPRAWVKPRPVCGVPEYPYSANGLPRPTVTVVSMDRIPLSRFAPATAGAPTTGTTAPPTLVGSGVVLPSREPQLYQLSQARMQVDHCFLSRVAVAFHENGEYQISFRADQNPQAGTADAASPLRAGERGQGDLWTLQTGQLLRNQFVIRVRGYGNYPAASGVLNTAPGKPVLVDLAVEPFWVQRGQPYTQPLSGRAEVVRRYFDYINRVEVEFTYR